MMISRITAQVLSCAVSAMILSGCMTYRYLPQDGQLAAPVDLPEGVRDYTIAFEYQGNPPSPPFRDGAEQELQTWFGGRGDDLKVVLADKTVQAEGFWTLVPYMLTLSLVPAVTTRTAESTLTIYAADQPVFSHTGQFQTRDALSTFFPTPFLFGSLGGGELKLAGQDQMMHHKRALAAFIVRSRDDYEQAVSAGTVDAYRAYLRDNPASFFRMDTLSRLAALAPAGNALAFHEANLELDAAYMAFLPDELDVWFVGPEGMTVHDVLKASRTEDEALLVSLIKAAGKPYKVFNADELAVLKKGGLSPVLIAAMIDVSAASGSASAGSLGAAPVAGAGQDGASPTAGDVAAQCAKRYAALQACDKVPGFGANICRNQVKSKYSHLACSVIQ